MTRQRPRLKAKTTSVLYALEPFAYGLSTEDLAARVGVSARSASARACWLRRAGLIAFSGAERVWTLTDRARRDLFSKATA